MSRLYGAIAIRGTGIANRAECRAFTGDAPSGSRPQGDRRHILPFCIAHHCDSQTIDL
ncbi:MAG: hypothetical protein KME57_22170 [Scytonema hyalinum WJT4-NPBG1]|nr:hypothetical protein [Scytonema hyalinum WJT4-NPBG1]